MNRFICLLAIASVAYARPGAPLAYSTGVVGHSLAAPYAVAHAPQVLHHAVATPVAHAVAAPVRAEPFDPHPQYQFGYSVSDQLTGDQHSHHESRDGDVVQGEYSLVEPDGAIRTVRYTSDPVNGFNAVVDRQRPAVAVAKAPVAVAHPVAHVAPAVTAVHAAQYAPTYAAHHPVTYATAGHPGLSYAAPAVHAVHSAVPAGVAYHHG